jgi:hypothetical protein
MLAANYPETLAKKSGNDSAETACLLPSLFFG